jgi:FkbM family methyltransferase
MYSQTNEQEYILKFFGDFKGTLLDIGANNGKTNSNSRALLEIGWMGVLVEPHPYAFGILNDGLLEGSKAFNYAIADYDGMATLHAPKDSQLSSIKKDFTKQSEKWHKFEPIEVPCVTIDTLYKQTGNRFDFITIDAEGCDFDILKQMAPDFAYCKMLSIECSGNERNEIKSYLTARGFYQYHTTNENLIMAR